MMLTEGYINKEDLHCFMLLISDEGSSILTSFTKISVDSELNIVVGVVLKSAS